MRHEHVLSSPGVLDDDDDPPDEDVELEALLPFPPGGIVPELAFELAFALLVLFPLTPPEPEPAPPARSVPSGQGRQMSDPGARK